MVATDCCCCLHIDLRLAAFVISFVELCAGVGYLGTGIFWGNITIAACAGIGSVFLFYGALKYSQTATKLHLYANMIQMIFHIISGIFICVNHKEKARNPDEERIELSGGLSYFPGALISLYFWLIVYGFWKGIEAGRIPSPA